MDNGLPSVVDPWYKYLTKNDLMSGDDVVFYYRFNERAWEVMFRKQVKWDEVGCLLLFDD